MGAPLHCFTCAGGGQILENWGKMEPKWHCGVVVEAVSHRWLYPTSILYVYKVIEHLHMMCMGIWVHPYTVIPVQMMAKFWEIGVGLSPHRNKQKHTSIHFYSFIFYSAEDDFAPFCCLIVLYCLHLPCWNSSWSIQRKSPITQCFQFPRSRPFLPSHTNGRTVTNISSAENIWCNPFQQLLQNSLINS